MKQQSLPYSALFLFFIFYQGIGQQLDYSPGVVNKVSYAYMKSGFENPRNEAKVRSCWWWPNGMATKTSITRDLSEMKAKGYGGAILSNNNFT